MIKLKYVDVVSVTVMQATESMKLLAHEYLNEGKLFVSMAWVPNRLVRKPYCWAWPSSINVKED